MIKVFYVYVDRPTDNKNKNSINKNTQNYTFFWTMRQTSTNLKKIPNLIKISNYFYLISELNGKKKYNDIDTKQQLFHLTVTL